MAPGYISDIAFEGLKFPRGIQWDTTGHLLVVDRGVGIYRFSVDSCLQLQDQKLIVNDTDLNHGISMSPDGKTLFASTKDVAYSWAYNSDTGDVTDRKTLVTGMASTAQDGHITRTLLSPVSKPDWLIISVGSQSNVDNSTLALSSGKSQVRAFNVSEVSENPVVFHEGGFVLGWGLRNSVGLGEDNQAQLWSVENSVDSVTRNGNEIHENNPAEELNFHGSLLDNFERGNYGYPNCFAVWAANEIPDQSTVKLETGDQFSMYENSAMNDSLCEELYQPPRISFHAHQAPLDIKFDGDGDAWISFHGSWNRAVPIGYRVVTVAFENGQPRDANNSQSAAVEIMANPDLTQCQTSCFRPVGLAFDTAGHLWMSSDATGEIYVIRKDDGSGVAAFTSNAAVSGPTPGPTPTGTGSNDKPSVASKLAIGVGAWVVSVMAGLGMMVYFL
ncbi:hypothetical protein H072_9382 [Dactylellina haptotyla CBS 200.50]|uniref:Pyrroloquinoline quinone-dependent pyranose dehydrogenase beta-propeller domain-containing protein n=1 Tax=Dactylellina haptotyla (strain CBS 200.50) TaxID=1284197 RepID=S8BP87_DACHA|nr:hypothetical protein H072_9382 [Dactylellina haptotyla CBS 200.50]